jgi:hypothetical protein
VVPAEGATVGKEAVRAAVAAGEKLLRETLAALAIATSDLPDIEKKKIRIVVSEKGAYDRAAFPRAVLSRTVGAAAPLWLTEGFVARIGGPVAAYRKDLRENEFSLEWEALLTEVDPEAFAANRGRALAWALVSLLTEARPELAPALYDRCRRLAEHLAPDKKARTVRRLFTDLAGRWLREGGATREKLRAGVTEWVAAGFPTGAAFRRTEVAKSLRGLTLPGTHSVTLIGTYGNAQTLGPDTGRLLEEPEVKWRLPFRSRMKLWLGLRGARAGSLQGNPVARNLGMLSSVPWYEWEADPSGRRIPVKLGVLVGARRGFDRYGIMLLEVRGPGGVRFLFFREWPIK